MARPRAQRRDGFTATGSGASIDASFGRQEIPPFKPKQANPHYLNRKTIRQQKGPQGAD